MAVRDFDEKRLTWDTAYASSHGEVEGGVKVRRTCACFFLHPVNAATMAVAAVAVNDGTVVRFFINVIIIYF